MVGRVILLASTILLNARLRYPVGRGLCAVPRGGLHGFCSVTLLRSGVVVFDPLPSYNPRRCETDP
ncbi:hypothetical protein SAMN00790413_00237 [Deinococcus hopiensis KR-140]|uniref:Uncharacterized protein n=1 Tax=Deinococcus hopiensis KR-140 TaxID=695939 RepID=A0A1W1V7R8_9DEIO|nr:hypothetical protein SAMN00790413_00237 [Deinococcus hopiensis KR-140]